MSEEVFRRGTHPIAAERVFRLLSSEIRIATNCQRIDDSLRYIVHNARHDLPIDHTFVYAVEEHDGRYSVLEQGTVVAEYMHANAVLVDLFERIQKRTHEAMGDWVRIHAGCGSGIGKRFLVVGEKYAGKSTLMARILFSDLDAYCDDSVLLRDGVIIPVPRKFYVREGSLQFLPQLAAIAPQLPFVYSAADGRVVAFDPNDAGCEWCIRPAPVDTIFWLVPNHGRPAHLEPCAKYRMVEYIMSQCNPPSRGNGNWVGDICAMVDRAETYNLHVGELEQSLRAVIIALVSK